MKSAVVASLIALATAQEDPTECTYCKMRDRDSGFLTSWSYCRASDNCLQDAWNYFNQPCNGGWKRGRSYDLDFCEAVSTECSGFVATLDDYQKYTEVDFNMAKQTFCTIKIDATAAVARVKLIPSNGIETLGIIEGDVYVDETYTVKQGVEEITIYNSAKDKAIQFTLQFSGASTLALAASVAAVASLTF